MQVGERELHSTPEADPAGVMARVIEVFAKAI
jgi:hypothetical protein